MVMINCAPGHNIGFVNPNEEEHDPYNIVHSKYDEDASYLYFENQPGVHGPIFNTAAPGGLYGPFRHAKDAMSYAPNDYNWNTFLSPKHYGLIWDVFRVDRGFPVGGGGAERLRKRLYTTGTNSSVATVATTKPPITARPSGAFCSPPSPSPSDIGTMPTTIANAVITTGRNRVWPASSAAVTASLPCCR